MVRLERSEPPANAREWWSTDQEVKAEGCWYGVGLGRDQSLRLCIVSAQCRFSHRRDGPPTL